MPNLSDSKIRKGSFRSVKLSLPSRAHLTYGAGVVAEPEPEAKHLHEDVCELNFDTRADAQNFARTLIERRRVISEVPKQYSAIVPMGGSHRVDPESTNLHYKIVFADDSDRVIVKCVEPGGSGAFKPVGSPLKILSAKPHKGPRTRV